VTEETALRRWVKRAEVGPVEGRPTLATTERAELIDLRKRLKRAVIERDIMKNAMLPNEGERVKFAFIDADRAAPPAPRSRRICSNGNSTSSCPTPRG
jgi:hypothetical protein